MRSGIRLLLALSVAAASPALASAQTDVQEQPTPGWVFTPAIGFGGSWDDNVLLADPTGNPPEDYATPINPRATLDYRGRRTRFSGGYEGSLLMYRRLSELNSSEQRIRAMLQHRFSPRLALFAQENHTRAPTTDQLQLAGVPFYRIGSRTNAVGGGLDALLGRHTTLRSVYTLRSVDFDADPLRGTELEGGHAHEILVTFGRLLSPRLTVGTQYELRRAILAQSNDRFNIQTGSLTIQLRPTEVVTVTGSLGVAHLGEGLRHQPHTGPALGASITRVGRYARLSAGYQRSFIPSFGFGGTFQNEEWVGSVHIPFARNRAYVDGGLTRYDNDPLESLGPSVRSLWLSSTLGYRATRWLSVEGYFGRSRQDTQRAGGDLDRNQLGFRVVAAKPMRLR
jgi:hypothetical protein